MRKLLFLFIAAMMIFGLAACGAQETAAESAVETSAKPETEQIEEVTGPFGEKDMIFVHDGISYPISTDASPLLEMFGGGYEEIVAPSCAFDGEDKQFIYDFATVYTYPTDGVDLINEIYIYDGAYETVRGIGLGDTLEDVIAAYGEGGFEEGTSYVYALSGDPEDTTSQRLFFELTDGVVTGISYFGANGIVL